MTTDSFDRLLKQAAHVSTPEPGEQALTLHPGATLIGGRLRIVRRVGEGGMGVVYEAHDAERRGSVALKTLSRLDPASVYRLKNEFRSLSDVSHPGLCRLYELFGEGGQWFFTMELIDGERFDRFVRPSATDACDEARLRALLLQLVDAIDAIHEGGKLHRDLKPSNVLVTRAGRVVVLDFGLAVDPELGGVGQTVLDGNVSGTPAYMAPEQAAGTQATAASDLYALGAMLFEALTGRLPFTGRSHEVLTDKQRLDAPRASELAGGVSSDLDALCAALLSRDPTARPSIEALRKRLGSSGPLERFRLRESVKAPAEAPLLGRAVELEALRAAFRASCAGKPTVMFVSGESGMGKSALVGALLDELRAQGQATVLAGRCHERENVPFKGFDALVDDLSRHLRRLPGNEAAALMPREAYALARIFPVLERVPAVTDAPKKELGDPQELKGRAFAAFGELFARMRDRAPLVCFIDDLQWLDLDSVRFLRALFVSPEPAPLLFIGAHRSEGARESALLQSVRRAAEDNPALGVRSLDVGALGPDALRGLIQRLRPEHGEATATRLVEQSHGNPFLAAVLARVFALPPSEGDTATATLEAALARHLAMLDLGARKLLSLLALVGQPLSAQLVLDAASLADGHVQLDELSHQQLLRVSFDATGARAVECYHDKIREHLAAALEPQRARELALDLARVLLARPDADPELLARCFEVAQRPEEAALHAARAAEVAHAALAFDRAAKLYTQALAHGRFDAERAQALRVGRALALAYAGRSMDAAVAYLEAAQHVDQAAAQELELRAGEQYVICGELKRGRSLLGQALHRFGYSLPSSFPGALAAVLWSRARLRLRGRSFTPRDDHDDKTLRELAALELASRSLVRSDQVRAVDINTRWLMRALSAGHAVHVARALAWEVMFCTLMNADRTVIDKAIAQCSELCERTRDDYAMTWLPYNQGFYEVVHGSPALALAHFDRGLALHLTARDATAVVDRAWFHVWRASCSLAQGRFAACNEVARPAFEDAVTRGDAIAAVMLMQQLCVAEIALDRPDQAARAVLEAEAWLPRDEVTVQYMSWLQARLTVGCYLGRAAEAWHATASIRETFFSSWQGRAVLGLMRGVAAGAAVTALRRCSDPAQRKEFEQDARRLLRGAKDNSNTPVPVAALRACLDGDRDRAIAALRKASRSPSPLIAQTLSRRLGELLRDAEGDAMIAEADAFLRAGGVVSPARFTAAFAMGLELPES